MLFWQEPLHANQTERRRVVTSAAVENRFQELIDHLREEPRAKALFETSAEVLGGLEKAFHDYESKNEPAWR